MKLRRPNFSGFPGRCLRKGKPAENLRGFPGISDGKPASNPVSPNRDLDFPQENVHNGETPCFQGFPKTKCPVKPLSQMSKIERIDYDKYMLFYAKFVDDLKAVFKNTEWERINDWAAYRDKSFVQIQQRNAEWLDEELRRFTNGLLRITHLKYNPQNNVKAAPDRADIRKIELNRKKEIADFEALLEQIVWNQRISQDSSPDVLVGDGSHTTETTEATTLKSLGFQYRKKWLQAFGKARRNGPGLSKQLETETHLIPFVQKLRNHRFDRYIWPAIQYRFGAPAMTRQADYLHDAYWTTLDSETEVRDELSTALANYQIVLMHDDAGMGKTAFSWMLFEHLLKINQEHSYVIRLEGIWPRSSDENRNPLQLMEVILEELLGKRLLGRQIQGYDTSSNSEEGFREALKKSNVFILLDGFDQMTNDDRAVAIEEIYKTVNSQSEIQKCHWLISGRPFSFRCKHKARKLFNENILRLRLKKFDENRQNTYFEDLSNHEYFKGQIDGKKQPLSFMCSNWKKEATESDLGIPLHLLEIRNVIEDSLTQSASAHDGRTLTEIRSSSELHARISDVYLRRTILQFEERDSIEANDAPETDAAKIDILRHICGCLAIQMMLDQNYNASIDNTTTKLQSYENTSRTDLVDAYLERCRNRYEYSKNSPVSYWAWGVEILQTSEVTHRNDIDVFTYECRSFRDRKAMEWYAAHYLMNHSTAKEWNEVIPNSGEQKIISFLGNTDWTRCWQLAMELPNNFYVEKKLEDCIKHVFDLPRDSAKRRPCEWMWIAWCKRLEQDKLAIQRMINPLGSAKDVIKVFRQEFNTLIKQGNAIAAELKFDADRDSPNYSLTNPNQTVKGQYRRIPDKGGTSVFFGDRGGLVSVSQFWLRKFMVTNEEYRLFDPSHNTKSKKFNRKDLPVTMVDWYMATMFCCWLGSDYRLPTEAEWETACRANKTENCGLHDETKYWFGNDMSEAINHAWYRRSPNRSIKCLSDSSDPQLHQNRWGLFDIAGNVWEWTSDWYANYSPESNFNPVGPKDGKRRVLRGGSWKSKCRHILSAFRGRYEPKFCDNSTGFRIAMSSSESSRSERETGKKVK